MTPIYLDNNATTPIDSEVADLVADTFRQLSGNPSSQHWAGRAARRLLEDARESVAEALKASLTAGDKVIFTSGGTEANNLALRGLAGHPPEEVIVSPIEHPSILESAKLLAAAGHCVIELPVDGEGIVAPTTLAGVLSDRSSVVSIMWVNNETGVLQPICQLAEVCRSAGVILHTDAVQGIGKLGASFRDLGVDAMSIAAHKFHGPCGVGALLVRGDIKLQPILHGGFQQFGSRPGTESVALAVGMAHALRLCQSSAAHREERIRSLRDELEQRLIDSIPSLLIHGKGATRAPHTSCFSIPGIDRQELAMALDMAGVACSTGSACASGSSEPSHVLRAMGVDDEHVSGAIRFSLSHLTTELEITSAAKRMVMVYRDLRSRRETQKRGATARQRASESI